MDQPWWPIPVTGIGGAAAGTCVWKQRGQIYATVVVKVTLGLVPDAAMALLPPNLLDRDERADPSGRGLCTGGDMAPTLAQAELWVIGHAQGIPAFDRRALDVRIALARDGGFIYEKRVSLDASGAFGSPVRLPLGVLGPLSRHWPVRARRLGGLDAALLHGPHIDLPARFDWEYFQTAPADQRLPVLRGDEWLILEGIYPDRPRLKTYLPRATGVARVYGRDGELRLGRPLRLGLDSLHIDVDRRCCSMLWRGYFPIAPQAAPETLHVVAGIEWPGRSLAWVNPFESRPAEQQPVEPSPYVDSPLESAIFSTGAEAQKAVKIAALADTPPPPDSDPCVDTVQLSDSDALRLAQIAATPFEANKASLPSRVPAIAGPETRTADATAGRTRPGDEDPMGTTLKLGDADVQKLAQAVVTPFVRPPAPAQRVEAPAAAEKDETLHFPETLSAKEVAAAVLPFVTASRAPLAPPPLIGTPTPEPEHASSNRAALSPDPPATLGAFFLAAMERTAVRRSA